MGKVEYKVLENHPQDSRIKIKEDGIFQTLGARGGQEYEPHTLLVLEIRTDDMQETTGCLSPGAHAGSYNGQDAYNDMLVVDDGNNINKQSGISHENKHRSGRCASSDGLQGSADGSENWGGGGEMNETVVRRLTPLECERLQGYPDGWTDIGEWTDSKGKKHKNADSPRYKALGNSIALPFWEWMAERICKLYNRKITMASLFDGIGGFPLVFSRHGATPVWASEIEEFPIAVTKIRFPESEEKK